MMTRRRRAQQLRHRVGLVITLCVAGMLALLSPAGQSQTTQTTKSQTPEATVKTPSSLVIRVGAIYYDDSAERYSEIRKVLSAIETYDQQTREKNESPITFKLEVGTYDEIASWYKSAQIDLAIMNPGPLGLLLDKYDRSDLDKAFVGIRKVEPRKTSVASQSGTTPRSQYNSIMLLNRQEMIATFPSLNRNPVIDLSPEHEQLLLDFVFNEAKKRQVHFLFVHPFSTSGYIFPRKFLKEKTDVALTPTDFEITYSHNVSVEEVAKSGRHHDGRLKVAFVSDETEHTLHDPKVYAIRQGIKSGLDTKIVQDALLLTPEFVQGGSERQLERVKELLQQSRSQMSFKLDSTKDWRKGYEQVRGWIEDFNGPTSTASEPVSIDQIIRRITNYNVHHEPARVALVLSGGGAKCAYQLGAVEVIEEKLNEAEKLNPDRKLGIDLVVGTSGGAINALTVAAEVTKDCERRKALRETWETFAQTEILRPSTIVRQLLGVWIGLSIGLWIMLSMYVLLRSEWVQAESKYSLSVRVFLKNCRALINRLRLVNRISWPVQAGTLMIIVAFLIFIGQTQISLTSWLSSEHLLRQHTLIHLAEYGRQTLRWAAIVLTLFGLTLWFHSYMSSHSSTYLELSRELRALPLAIAVLIAFILPLYTLHTSFVVQDSLFVSAGIEEKMSVEIPKLLGCDVGTGPFNRSLSDISKEIIDKGLIKRDLVITGSMLPAKAPVEDYNSTSAEEADTDLYFVYKANDEIPRNLYNDSRFVSLRESPNRSILLDAVIGSGAIFPAFEPRKLEEIKRINSDEVLRNVSIIDGGFVHNSPIEAAIKLKATHIIVIEASPKDQPFESENLITNSVAAFNYLFTQAQLLDARSQRQAEIFTLRPAALNSEGVPYLCTLDFGKNYIEHAMKLGREDAKRVDIPRFTRQPRPYAP